MNIVQGPGFSRSSIQLTLNRIGFSHNPSPLGLAFPFLEPLAPEPVFFLEAARSWYQKLPGTNAVWIGPMSKSQKLVVMYQE